MSDEIQVPPPPHVKFTKQGRAYVDIDYLIERELARPLSSERVHDAGKPST